MPSPAADHHRVSDPAADILEYCEIIGLDPERDAKLLWIAREGIKAPLPPDWGPWWVWVGKWARGLASRRGLPSVELSLSG